jgi:hypothetical protein
VPRFSYFLETVDQPIEPEDPAWQRPLPLSRDACSRTCREPAEAAVSIGDYFQAVQLFLETSGRDALVRSLGEQAADAAFARDVRIFLAKHGEYYHPARVETEIGGRLFQRVVNVAVSAAGRALLLKDYANLERLNREFPRSYVPRVYGTGQVDTGKGRPLALFLAEWFSGFCEFHLTQRSPGVEHALLLWDPENGNRYLDSDQARWIYHEVARILTHYFNLDTLESVGSWHHAAGDFVAKLTGSRLEIRMVTVRRYGPVFRSRHKADDACPDPKTLLEILLIFLLDLSIRTRLDRLDGTGDIAWSDLLAVGATVDGMLAGLVEKPTPFELPLPLDQLFKHYLAACSADDILDLCKGIAARYRPEAPERPVVNARIAEHAEALHDALGRL